MALLQEEQASACYHCKSKQVLQQGSWNVLPRTGAEQRFTKGRAGLVQLKCLHIIGADFFRPLGLSHAHSCAYMQFREI